MGLPFLLIHLGFIRTLEVLVRQLIQPSQKGIGIQIDTTGQPDLSTNDIEEAEN